MLQQIFVIASFLHRKAFEENEAFGSLYVLPADNLDNFGRTNQRNPINKELICNTAQLPNLLITEIMNLALRIVGIFQTARPVISLGKSEQGLRA